MPPAWITLTGGPGVQRMSLGRVHVRLGWQPSPPTLLQSSVLRPRFPWERRGSLGEAARRSVVSIQTHDPGNDENRIPTWRRNLGAGGTPPVGSDGGGVPRGLGHRVTAQARPCETCTLQSSKCTHARAHTNMCAHADSRVHTHTQVPTCTHVHVSLGVRVRPCTHIHTCAHTPVCTHKCVHTSTAHT